MRISDWSSDVCSSDLPRKDVCRHDQSSARHSYATPLEQFTENRINFAPVMHLAHDEAPVEIAHRFICPPKITACGEHSPGKRIFFPAYLQIGDILRRSDDRRVGKACGSTCRSR